VASRFKWEAVSVVIADCMTCDWTWYPKDGKALGAKGAARAMDHARRSSHRVVLHRTIEYDFTRSTRSIRV